MVGESEVRSRVRYPPPPPLWARGHTWMIFLCETVVPSAYHSKIHFSQVLCWGVVGVYFISDDFFDELALTDAIIQ